MKKLASLLLFVFLLAFVMSGFATPLAPTAMVEPVNKVGADFSTRWIYDSPEDAFTNGQVTGMKDWLADIGTKVPLTGLALTLDSTLNFDHIMKENLTTTGPPTYVRSFGDVPPGTNSVAYVGFGSLDSPDVAPVTFAPGFDASRSADKTEFSAPGTQTLTITVTPREGTERFGIVIHADENDLVNPLITSPTSGDGIELKREGHSLHINPTGLALNTTWTITVIIRVTPKVPEVEYMPYVGIGRSETLASGTASGDSVSLPVTDMGTWTWSVEGGYEWDWTAHEVPGYNVAFSQRANSPPTLTSGGVSPPSGTLKTDFTFEVTYRDTDRGEGRFVPSYVRVYLDGSAHDMGYIGFTGQGYADGALFSHKTTLSPGQHTYYFEASDGFFTARFPEDGTLSIGVPVWIVVGIAAGIAIIIGSVTYFFIRRRRGA